MAAMMARIPATDRVTRSVTRAAAAAYKVFSVAELLEIILLRLDMKSLSAARQTCKMFEASYQGSNKLKTVLFQSARPVEAYLPHLNPALSPQDKVGVEDLAKEDFHGGINPRYITGKLNDWSVKYSIHVPGPDIQSAKIEVYNDSTVIQIALVTSRHSEDSFPIGAEDFIIYPFQERMALDLHFLFREGGLMYVYVELNETKSMRRVMELGNLIKRIGVALWPVGRQGVVMEVVKGGSWMKKAVRWLGGDGEGVERCRFVYFQQE